MGDGLGAPTLHQERRHLVIGVRVDPDLVVVISKHASGGVPKDQTFHAIGIVHDELDCLGPALEKGEKSDLFSLGGIQDGEKLIRQRGDLLSRRGTVGATHANDVEPDESREPGQALDEHRCAGIVHQGFLIGKACSRDHQHRPTSANLVGHPEVADSGVSARCLRPLSDPRHGINLHRFRCHPPRPAGIADGARMVSTSPYSTA